VIPGRIRWAVETLAVEPGDRLLEIEGGPRLAASLVCERLDRGKVFAVNVNVFSGRPRQRKSWLT
jgi:hypothetical protein